MLERHADPLDEAAELSASLVSGAIAAANAAVKPEFHPDFDGQHCVDCDTEIPTLRLRMGRVRCVSCQEMLEKQQKRQQTAPTCGWDTTD